jgi:hypothetical protein
MVWKMKGIGSLLLLILRSFYKQKGVDGIAMNIRPL